MIAYDSRCSTGEGGMTVKALIVALAFGVVVPVSAFAQDAPPFLKAIAPQATVSSAWQEWMTVFNPKGALDGKTKELIGLAVAAQIPCEYLHLRSYAGGQACWSDRRSDQGSCRGVGAGAENEH
jgi:hypothetical protein